jgi:putative tryptophan/tyrosine transport system substrate-binding protein
VRTFETSVSRPEGCVSAQMSGMWRREFLALIWGAVLAFLAFFPASGQQRDKIPIVGFVGATSPTIWAPYIAAFRDRMRELGWIDGQNIAFELRWAEGHEDRYAEFAAELIRLNARVILTSSTGPVIALKNATSTIPIVFAAAGDPVGTGLVSSLAHPGGNVTGLSNQQTDLAGRRLAFLQEIVPDIRRVGVMGNVTAPNVVLEMNAVVAAASKLGLDVVPVALSKADDIVPGMESLNGKVDALYICTDPLLTLHRVRISTFAARQKLPTVYAFREYVEAGGLLSYGPNFPHLFRRAADFVDKILRGARPSDIPVEQPTRYDLILNLTTAKALGLAIPESFLLRADQVLE